MFVINSDMSIYCTRGDCGNITVTAEEDGLEYTFKRGDIVRFKAFCKKACASVVIQKEVEVIADTQSVAIYLSGAETKIGEIINKPVDYWYEIELNPYTTPKTLVGYDDDGPKLFRLFPEGKDVKPEDVEDLPQASLYDMVAEALTRAKASGIFDGEDGHTPQKGVDYWDGTPGYTPQKGVDYFTAADIAEIKDAVLSSIASYAGETEDI